LGSRFIVRAIYSLVPKQGPRLFRATPLYNCLTGYLVKGFVDAGEKLCFEVSFATSDLGEAQRLASIDEAVKIFNTSARLEAVNIELAPPRKPIHRLSQPKQADY
jgi:hypothetical protein